MWRTLGLCLLVGACGGDVGGGPVDVKLIQPAGLGCKYTIAPARIESLDSLMQMRGAIGRVVVSGENLNARPEILDLGAGLFPVDVQFTKSGDVYVPLDYHSLFSASLYFSIETAAKLFASLDAASDMFKVVPNLSDTMIVHETKRSLQRNSSEETDNAEYLPHEIRTPSGRQLRNYFFSYPSDEVERIPLGMNLGIMVHEFTHLVANYLFLEPVIASGVQLSQTNASTSTLWSWEEGLGDYFGAIATKDPMFFDCSYPGTGRNLNEPKHFTDELISRLESDPDFDIHEGGAVWASINWEIGEAVGHEAHARTVIKLMRSLAGCVGGSPVNFGTIARCHVTAAGSGGDTIKRIYGKYLGRYGAGL